MSYEILNKISNGSVDCVIDEIEAENAEEMVTFDEDVNEELKASIENIFLKKHIAPNDRRIQQLNSELLSSIQGGDTETFTRFCIN